MELLFFLEFIVRDPFPFSVLKKTEPYIIHSAYLIGPTKKNGTIAYATHLHHLCLQYWTQSMNSFSSANLLYALALFPSFFVMIADKKRQSVLLKNDVYLYLSIYGCRYFWWMKTWFWHDKNNYLSPLCTMHRPQAWSYDHGRSIWLLFTVFLSKANKVIDGKLCSFYNKMFSELHLEVYVSIHVYV